VERTILTWRISKDKCCRIDGSGRRICYQITVRVDVRLVERRQWIRREQEKTSQRHYGGHQYAFLERHHCVTSET
jgi:hypothetical protein